MVMSSSERFDIATGILSVLVLLLALLERALPRTRLSSLEKSLKHTEADLDALFEDGLLGEDTTHIVERVDELRQQSNQLAARVHTASSVHLQLSEMCKGLSCRLSALHRRILCIQAEIVSRKLAPIEKQPDQRSHTETAIPDSLSVARLRDDPTSGSRSRRSSGGTSSRPHISRSSSKVFIMSTSSRQSSSSSSLSAVNNRSFLNAAGTSRPLNKHAGSHRSTSVPGPRPRGNAPDAALPRVGSSRTPSGTALDLSVIQEDDRTKYGGHHPISTSSRGRRMSRSGMFFVAT